MRHIHSDRKRRDHSVTLRRDLLYLALLLVCAAGLSACDGEHSVRLELVSRVLTEGPATAVAWDATRQLVYVGAGETVTVVVETAPGQWEPQPDGTVALPSAPRAIEVSNGELYVACDGGVYAIDAQQGIAASYAGLFDVQGLRAYGDKVYAALNWQGSAYQCGLHVLGASGLAKLGAVDEPVAIGFVCSPETVFRDVAVAPPLAYVVGDSVCGQRYAKAFLGAVDVSQPGDLPARGKVELDYLPANAIALAGNYAYVAGTGLYVVDVSDADAPSLVTRFATPRELTDAVLSLPYVYVCDVSGRVLAIDVSDPALPRAASGWYETGFAAHDLRIGEPYLYLANDKGGLAVLRAVIQP